VLKERIKRKNVMEICCKCKIFIKNGRFWNKKERGMRKDFKILDKNRSF